MRYAWRALLVVGLACVVIALNVSTLNVALPKVVRHFNAGPVAASWVLLGYMLANTVLLVVFGRLADMFGRRRMYLAGMSVFTAASLAAGLAPNVWLLIALRVVQAAGGAMILVNGAAIVTDAFPSRLLNRGLGVYMASFSVAQLLGPSVGGFVVAAAGWQWVFWFNVPVGVLCVICGTVTLRKVPRGPTREHLDVPGNLLLLLGLCGLLLALSEAQTGGWDHPMFGAALAIFAASLPVFMFVQRRVRNPLLDLELFRDRAFCLSIAASFVNTMSRFSVVLLIALFFQAANGDGPFEAGLRVMPLPISTMIASASVGLLDRFAGPRGLAVVGSATGTAGMLLLFLTLSADAPYAVFGVAMTLIGLGGGIFLPSNTTAIMLRSPENRLGLVNAMRLMLQNVGLMVGTAVSLVLITGPLPPTIGRRFFAGTVSEISPAAVQTLVVGYRYALLLLVVTSLLGTVATIASRSSSRRTAAPEAVPTS
ncbi:MAG: MFS transporter [Streptosporangiales bacterium]|nr:MFS transporter [Streptosporangiales bacterium]